MSGERETIWDIESHTLAKHAILRKYLQAWFPIMTTKFKALNYIDGFAGPGVYKGGEEGSPVIAIKTAIELNKNLNSKIGFTFIESKEDRAENLKSVLNSMQIPDNFKYDVIISKFDETLTQELDKLNEQNLRLAPCFAFIDPFGISDTPFSVIRRIMSFKSCEVLITFMSGSVNRFKELSINREHINKLLGTTNWNPDLFIEGENSIVNYYQERLSTVAEYVRSFEMKNKSNVPIYRLIFATNSYLGLQRMKESMWKVDLTGQYSYSDITDPYQKALFEIEPNYNKLKKLIVDNFEGKQVTLDEIEKFVVIQTHFRETHFKTKILANMEKANPPEVEIVKCKPDRKKCTYADKRMIIRFSPKFK
jgi:three-Cys-motif partner protein